jgi:hypothetical protein
MNASNQSHDIADVTALFQSYSYYFKKYMYLYVRKVFAVSVFVRLGFTSWVHSDQ